MVAASSKTSQAFRSALTAARRYLRYGTRSTQQVRAHLAARGVPKALAESVIDACTRARQLDDQASVTLWVNHLADRGYAWSAIHQLLLTKGFDAQYVAETIQRMHASAPDLERARAVVRARASRGAAGLRASTLRRRQQLARLLARRGFDSDLIERVLVESFGDRSDE